MTNQQSSPVWVVIPAAGLGQRMQSELPKQYLKVHNKTLIEHTLDCFLDHQQVAGVVVVLSSDDDCWHSLNIKSKTKPLLTVLVTVQDDSNRGDSVMRGLKFLHENHSVPADKWVMVHDAARPCLSKVDIDSLLAIRDTNFVGGILASPVRDTMKRAVSNEDLDTVSHTESRENLWHALTPQMFRLGDLTKALQYCQNQGITVTDECSAMESSGVNPMIIEGSHNNIKVTYPSDIELASFIISKKTVEK